MTLTDRLLLSADAAIFVQGADGSLPAGHNGPYRDEETPVRNTAHWLLLLGKAYRLTGMQRYRSAGEAALGYLLSPAARPVGATFYCRSNPRKDFANGLIGQAWVVESLVDAAEVFDAPEALDLALATIVLHPFDEKRKLWRRVNVDGSWSSIDETFNHQLWFAASTALALRARELPEVRQNLDAFLHWVGQEGLRIAGTGRICHAIPNPSIISLGLRTARRLRDPMGLWKDTRYMARKEAGYQAFNTYAFGMLKLVYPAHPLWTSLRFRQALRYLGTKGYEAALVENNYGFSYNPPGFEVAFTISQFPEPWGQRADDAIRDWLNRQFKYGWDLDRKMLTRGTLDPMTAAARIYEIVRLPKLDIDLDDLS